MLIPRMTARVEKRLDSSRHRVDPGEVRTLMQIALRAGQGKILFIVRPAMLLRDDVLNLICDERLIGLAGAAIFAATARSLPNKLPNSGTDHTITRPSEPNEPWPAGPK